MKNGKFANNKRKSFGSKPLALLLACTLLVGCAAGGTIAWLTSKTEGITNTFTDSDINIELKETTTDYKMVPGCTIAKDPVVTVEADSEDCLVFVKVTESCGVKKNETENYKLTDFITYEIDPNNWTQLDGEEGVYYCYAKDITADRKIKVLGYMDGENFVNNEVLVKDTVTKEMMEAVKAAADNDRPQLIFTAYAIQLNKNNTTEFTPAAAWEQVNPDAAGDAGNG